MTRYILHGGNMRAHSDDGRALFTTLTELCEGTPRILFCFFAEDRAVWAEKYAEWTGRVAHAITPVVPECVLATPEEFERQADACDVLFLYGGVTDRMAEVFGGIPVAEIFPRFAAVLGSSAGAIFLATESWACDSRALLAGSGILPVKTVVHYGSTAYDTDPRGPIHWEAACDELARSGDTSLPILRLKEAAYEVIEQ